MADISPAHIIRALLDSHLYDLKERGEYLRGVCPQCGEKSLYIGKDKPYVLRCTRMNKCAFEQTVREALPDFFADFAKRFPPTEENHHATADAYLAMDRGFDLGKMRGWYEQAVHQVYGTTTYIPTVRFYLDEHRTRWWERLMGRNGKDGKGAKALFGGRKKEDGSLYRGDAWMPPGMTIEKLDRVFIVEGIFHAIALFHAGYKAVASFSSNAFPDTFITAHAKKGVKWTVAMDADAAGSRWAKRHHKRLKDMHELASVCLPPSGKGGQDWDDLWRAGRLDSKCISQGLYEGRLFTAESVAEKAYHYYMQNLRNKFILDFRSALYSIKMEDNFNKSLHECARNWEHEDAPTNEEAPTEQNSESAILDFLRTPEGRRLFEQHCGIDQISNVNPVFLYIESDPIMEEQRYCFSISYGNGQKRDNISLEGSAIKSPDAFHCALLNRSRGGTFDGGIRQLKILRDQWFNPNFLTVTSLPFVGYDPTTKAYIFQDRAWHKGQMIPINEHGYFEVGTTGIKSILTTVPIYTGGAFSSDWLANYVRAFHWQGLASLAFFAGSLFVQQIRDMQQTFPFLELTGEPGAGKSTILEFLWKCLGREEYEGFDLLKSSAAGRRRAFSQVSNLPVVIIESDRDNGEKDARQKQFGFDEVKPFFNGRGTGTLGVARRGNATEESKFQASLVISQNAEVEGSEALLQRIVHCHADKKHHGPGTRDIARWFERQTTATVGGFLGAALKKEREFLQAYAEAFERIECIYSASDLKNERIIKNHAQVAACGEALRVIFGAAMTDVFCNGLFDYVLSRALTREKRLAADHPLVEQFWDCYDYINGQKFKTTQKEHYLNHAVKPGYIAVNFNQYIEECRAAGQPIPDLGLLKKLLQGSTKRRFLASNKCVYSRHDNRNVKCWLFQIDAISAGQDEQY